MNGDVTPEMRQLLRRIAVCFLFVVVTLPLVMFGGQWSWFLAADILVAAYALRMALQLRALRRSE